MEKKNNSVKSWSQEQSKDQTSSFDSHSESSDFIADIELKENPHKLLGDTSRKTSFKGIVFMRDRYEAQRVNEKDLDKSPKEVILSEISP